ncbi:MAG: SPOCS domain-containing protein [Sarcina sp.]
MALVKTASRTEVIVGDIITYELEFTNDTTYLLNSVVIKDLLNSDLDFIEGSVKVKGIGAPNADILAGVEIGTLAIDEVAKVTFDAEVIGNETGLLDNTATVVYNYIDPVDGELKIGNDISNLLSIIVATAELTITKEGNPGTPGIPGAAQLGDIITYTVVLENTGTTEILNTILKDLISTSTSLVPGSVTVDGIGVADPNLAVGLNVGEVIAGIPIMVVYQVKVVGAIEDPIKNKAYAQYDYRLIGTLITGTKNTDMQIVETDFINLVVPTLVKTSNLSEIVVGEVLTYELIFTNTTGYILNSVVVKDLLSPELDFVEGSVKINAMSVPDADILAGVQIGPVGVNSSVSIFFDALVISKIDDYIDNQATAVYKYTDPADGLVKIGDVDSNLYQVLVEIAQLDIEKNANTDEVQLNDIIDYQIILRNTGTVELFDIIVKDVLSPALELVPNSVHVNGVLVNTGSKEKGLNVGSIPAGGQVIIDYKAKVISGTCSGYIENEAWATYCYKLPNSATNKKKTNVASVSICVTISSFKQQALSKSITLPLAKPDIEEIDDVVVEVLVDDSYVVETMVSESHEGQNLSGFKLIIHGRLKMSIEYTALLPTQPMHSAHCEVPFSSFLILPPDYVQGSYVEVSTELENMEVDLIDCRSAMVNVIFLIIAKIS